MATIALPNNLTITHSVTTLPEIIASSASGAAAAWLIGSFTSFSVTPLGGAIVMGAIYTVDAIIADRVDLLVRALLSVSAGCYVGAALGYHMTFAQAFTLILTPPLAITSAIAVGSMGIVIALGVSTIVSKMGAMLNKAPAHEQKTI